MKKILLLALFFVATAVVQAQTVLGIALGSSYETVKTALEERYGKFNVKEVDGQLKIYGLTMGEFHFDFGTFSFQRKGSQTYFSDAEFQKYYSPTDESIVKGDRDYLYSIIKDKYADEYLEEYVNEQGFKCYKFGLNPRDEDKVLGLIQVFRATSKGGEKHLYLRLEYGPIYYIDKASDF